MAKTLQEAALTTRNARAKLEVGVHWRGIDPEIHLGYRRGKRGGTWLVRWRAGEGYRQQRLGTADDATAEGTLDFNAAIKAARESVDAARIADRAKSDGPVQTVRDAIVAYVNERNDRVKSRTGKPVRSDAAHRLERYITGREARGGRAAVDAAAIADVPLHELDEDVLLEWRESLPASLKKATRGRLANDLKAALNAAFLRHRKKLPPSLPITIKYGLGFDGSSDGEVDEVARENQVLSDEVIGRVIEAARAVDETSGLDGDLYRLILVMAATGARFSQIVRLRVADVQTDRRRLIMPASRKGRGKKQSSTPVPIGADILKVLEAVTTGRGPDELLLERWKLRQAKGGIKWERHDRGPWFTPSEITRPWRLIREMAGLDDNIVPYALRHSSIVRGVRAGLPIRLVAALHDTSVAMIERHYGRWVADGLDDLAASAVVPLVPQAA